MTDKASNHRCKYAANCHTDLSNIVLGIEWVAFLRQVNQPVTDVTPRVPLTTHDSVTPSATCRLYTTSCYEFSMQPLGVQFQYKLSALWMLVPRTKQTCQPSGKLWVQLKTGNHFEYHPEFWKLKKPRHKSDKEKFEFPAFALKYEFKF